VWELLCNRLPVGRELGTCGWTITMNEPFQNLTLPTLHHLTILNGMKTTTTLLLWVTNMVLQVNKLDRSHNCTIQVYDTRYNDPKTHLWLKFWKNSLFPCLVDVGVGLWLPPMWETRQAGIYNTLHRQCNILFLSDTDNSQTCCLANVLWGASHSETPQDRNRTHWDHLWRGSVEPTISAPAISLLQ